MKKLLILFAGIVSLVLLASCAKDEANLSGSISGLVTEYASANTPIAGATVTLNGKGLSKTTGSDGRFEFSNLEPGTYTIAVKANNFQANTKQVTVYAGQKANCDVQLTVEKVSIDISPMNLVFDKTVDQLSFIITNQSTRDLSYNLASYMQELEVSPMLGSIKAKGQQAVNVKVTNRASVKKTVSGQVIVSVGSDSYQVNVTINGTEEEVTTGNVMGTITDYANANAPIAGATVTLSTTGQSKTTGSDGRYEFAELTPGKYTITVSANEYEGSKKDVNIEAGKNVTCDFQLQKGAADVTVTPQSLTYASDVDQLSFTIKNGSSSTQQYTVSNVPEFASVSSSTGMISSKGSEAIMVTIPNRKQIKEKKSGQLTVNVGNNAFVVSLSVEPYQEEPVNVDIVPQTLNFDINTEQLTFTMTSKNNRELNYAITSDLNILTVTPAKGTLKEKGKGTITVNVQDRQKIDVDRVGKLTIEIEGNTYVVTVNVAKYDVNVSVSPQNLSFNNDTEQLTFSITNNNAQMLDYSISSDLDDILTISPYNGNINAKEKKDIAVSVKNRKDIATDKSGKLTIVVSGKTYTANVYISKAQTDASISPQTLTFDKDTEQLSFTITNNNIWANSYSVSSNLSNLTLSPSTGSVSAKGQQAVTVKVNDRKNVTSDQSGKITVTIGGSVYSVDVSVAKYEEKRPEISITGGLQAYYTFDAGNADDSYGTYHGILNGGTFITDTPNGKGKALSLKRKDFVNIAYNPLEGRKSFSISMWLKDFGTGTLFNTSDGYHSYGPTISVTEQMKLYYIPRQSSGSDCLTLSNSLSSYQAVGWTMFTVVTDASTQTTIVYINGKRFDSIKHKSNTNSAGTNMTIGGSYYYFGKQDNWADPMKVDNVRIYSVALSDEQVSQIYTSEK